MIKQLVGNQGREASIKWDGSKEDGSRAPSGVYVIVVQAGSSIFKQRTVLIR